MLWFIGSILCLIPSLTIIYFSPPSSVLFQWHPFCMSISFGLIFTILAHQLRKQPNPAWSVFSKKRSIHSYGMLAGFFSAIIGFSVVYFNKNLIGKPHFASWHGKFGLATFLIMIVQTSLGLPVFFRVCRVFPGFNLTSYRKYHSFCGILFAICSCFVFVTAFQTGWFKRQLKEEIVQPVQVSFSLIIVYSYVLIIFQVYNRYKPVSGEYEAVATTEN